MILTGKEPSFRKRQRRSNPYYIILLLVFIMIGFFVMRAFQSGDIEPYGLPTPIPTRTANSYKTEGETYFLAGNLDSSMDAYNKALELEPDNATIWAELARIKTYSSANITVDALRIERLEEALEAATRAVELAPEDSYAHGIRAFALSWYASSALDPETRSNSLSEAEREAIAALTFDNGNTLALVYYAEIQATQSLILQAQSNIEQALAREPDLMDAHRVHGFVLESMGYYRDAINAYQRAVELNPNLTFIYIRMGVNYRQLQQYETALEQFAKAARINEQNGINDPLPYLAIGRTYTQMGEFFIAARNVEKVLDFDPSNPDIYGTLGIIYFRGRNYEGAIPALQCATYGCDAETSCAVRFCDPENEEPVVIPPTPLSGTTVVYYYTYGSVLAGMHMPGRPYCEEAVKVLADVRERYSQEPVIMSIVRESENICRSFGYEQ